MTKHVMVINLYSVIWKFTNVLVGSLRQLHLLIKMSHWFLWIILSVASPVSNKNFFAIYLHSRKIVSYFSSNLLPSKYGYILTFRSVFGVKYSEEKVKGWSMREREKKKENGGKSKMLKVDGTERRKWEGWVMKGNTGHTSIFWTGSTCVS